MKDQQHQNGESTEFITLSKCDYDALVSEKENLQLDVLYLKQELDKLRRMIFSHKSERFVATDNQPLLFDDIETGEKQEVKTEDITYTRKKKADQKTNGHARMPLPAHLPRVEKIIEPDEDITGAKMIGEEITEMLDFKPGRLVVNRYVRRKYALPENKGIVIGELPTFPIPRGNAEAGLLSHIIISKYCDHIPFHRKAQMFRREGVEMAESTINGWFRATCELKEPLYDCLRKEVLKSSYLQGDETPIPVQTVDKPGATHKGYIWVYYDPLERNVLFDYQKTRGREGPAGVLKDFSGTLQTDGYEVYKMFEKKEGVILLACMAHARRKFDEAKNNDKDRAEHMLKLIQQLYNTERKARENSLPFEERKILREKEARPVLTDMEAWLKENLLTTLPKSAIGKAIAYTLTLWPRLIRYMDDGRYEIDNNLIENTIRPIAIGRKNYMFCGSHEAAQRAAMMYSLLGTCKLHNVEPFSWLREVLMRISDHPANRLKELLPQNLIIPVRD